MTTFSELAAETGHTPETLARYLNLGNNYSEDETLSEQDETEYRKALNAVDY
jgi:hypothetical protein